MSLVNEYAPLDLEALLAPLDANQPAGYFDEEDETYQAIDQEMVKLGSLHEGGMDWPYIDEAAQLYLGRQCKHLRVAGHLVSARLRVGTWRAWSEALALLAGMVEHYWETAYPKPGPTGYLAKRRIVALLVDRLGEALGSPGPRDFAAEHEALARRALDTLQASAGAAQLDEPMLVRLAAQFSRRVEETHSSGKSEPTPMPAPGQKGGQAISPDYFGASGGLQLGNERESRRTLLTVADFVNQQDAYDPAGYQLRRFALWGHIRAAPQARREQRTELMGVPTDIVEGYQEALASNMVDPSLLQRIEKSVVSSPYWVRGSFLAAGVATRLEMKEVAAAIRHATERFVRRIPLLLELRFSDGRPFVDAEVHGWLSGAEGAESQGSPVQEYASLREELASQLENEGVEVVLHRLQELWTAFSAPRQRSYATVIAADMLATRGLSWLAEDLYANVERVMQSTPADQWEPELYEHLALRTRSPRGIEQGRNG